MVNPNQEWAEAILVRDGIILAIGTNAEVETQIPENIEKTKYEFITFYKKI